MYDWKILIQSSDRENQENEESRNLIIELMQSSLSDIWEFSWKLQFCLITNYYNNKLFALHRIAKIIRIFEISGTNYIKGVISWNFKSCRNCFR